MADTSNLSKFLTDVADAIRTKKETTEPIAAEQFDQEILSIETGMDTSDATASATDIVYGKIAYGNDGKIVGTVQEVKSGSQTGVGTLRGFYDNSAITGKVQVTTNTEYEKLYRVGSILTQDIPAETVAQKIGLTPDKLMKGNTILNIEGTAEGGGGSSGDIPVKLFETVEEMQSDETAQEGDLAVVYRNEVLNATVDSRFQTATFPQTVVLDKAITAYIEVRYRAVDSSKMFDCWGQLDSSMFMMDCWSDSGGVSIQYTSSDGITYTRTDTTGNPVDFGTEIYYAYSEMWNDAIGKFIQVGGNTFDGLYECNSYLDKSIMKFIPLSAVRFDDTEVLNDTVFPIWDGKTFVGEYVSLDKIQTIMQKLHDDGVLTVDKLFMYLFLNKNNEICTMISTGGSGKANMELHYSIDPSTKLVKDVVGISSAFSYKTSYGNATVYKLDLDNLTYTAITTVTEQPYTKGSETGYYRPYTDVSTCIIGLYLKDGVLGTNGAVGFRMKCINPSQTGFTAQNGIDSTLHITDDGVHATSNNMSGDEVYPEKRKYFLAPTQLTLGDASQLLPGKIAYGKNGVVTADGSIWDSIPVEVIQARVANPQNDIIKVTAQVATDIKSGEIYWKTPEDKHLELSPTIPINSGLLVDAFAKSGIDSTGYGGNMTDGAMFIGGYIGQTKQKHVYVFNELFAVYDYATNTWFAGKTSDSSKPAGQASFFIYTNDYMYYPVSTSTSSKYKMHKVDLSNGNVVGSVELPQYEIGTGYLGNKVLMPSHNENYLYVSDNYQHHGCIDFANNKYVEFADLTGVYSTCMLLSVPNTNNVIELQVQNGNSYKKFILKQISPTGSVVKTYTTNDFANTVNNANQQRYFVDYNAEKITVVGTSNDYQAWVISYDVVNDVIAGTANTGYKDTNNINGVCEYTSPEQFMGFYGLPNAYPTTVNFSTRSITRSDVAEKRLTYKLIQKVNGVPAKQKLLLEGYALLMQTAGDNSSSLTLLNFENKFSDVDVIDYSGTVSPEEYNTAIETVDEILGEEV